MSSCTSPRRAAVWGLLWPLALCAFSVPDSTFVVKTHDVEALGAFACTYGLSVKPLIGYPDPSDEVLARFGCYHVVSVDEDSPPPDGLLEHLLALPGVELAEPDPRIHIEECEPGIEREELFGDTFYHPYIPDDPLFNEQWDKVITQTDWAWRRSTGDADVVIAILDTGADTDHEDLEPNLIPGYNTIEDTTDIEDKYGHGSHVAGIAAARIDNQKGIAGLAGNCSLMPVKVVGDDGNYTNSDLAEGVLWAADHGALVINMSLAGSPSAVLEDAVNYADSAGVFMCAAAGNQREEASQYPAAYEPVMSVGATTDEDDNWADSNYGETVAIWAPGRDVLSVRKGGNYEVRRGTSMASPQVAGLAALVWSVHPDYTNHEVWDKIISSADTIESSRGTVLRMNSRAALDVVGLAERRPEAPVVSTPEIQKGRLFFACTAHAGERYALRVFDATGREAYSCTGIATPRMSCDAALSTGVYFWRFTTGTGTASGRFVYIR